MSHSWLAQPVMVEEVGAATGNNARCYARTLFLEFVAHRRAADAIAEDER